MEFAQWVARHNQEACDACRKVLEQRGEKVPCDTCEHGQPSILDENKPVLWLIQRMAGAMHDGFGGVNVMAIKQMLELHGLTEGQAGYCLNRILTYCNAIAKARESKKVSHG